MGPRLSRPSLAGLFLICLLAALPSRAALAGDMAIADPRPPGAVEGRVHSYLDDNRLYVTSMAGALDHPLSAALSLKLRAVADWIVIAAPPAPDIDPHAGHAGHGDHLEEDDNTALVDAVSGASARVGTANAGSRESRAEGALGLAWRRSWADRPVLLSAETRISHEPDYASFAGILSGQIELARRNATLSAFLGAGRDAVSPAEAPPGQQGLWPAEQIKTSAGFSLAQVVTPRLVVSGGASGALQRGRLSSPYRNSLVGITYFPEDLPEERLRATAFLQASWYLGRGTALHARQGLYADDWDVTAWIPEAALSKELGRLLLTLKHRFYAQSRAGFYRADYPDRNGFQTGDLRLGKLYDQTGGIEAEYRMVRGAGKAGPVVLTAEYGFSRLEYPDLGARTLVSHVFSIGVRSGY